MKKCFNRNKNIYITLIFIVITFAVILCYPKKEAKNDNDLGKSLAIYVETKPFTKTYEVDEFVPFDDYTLNVEKSTCLDEFDNLVDVIITYDETTGSVTTSLDKTLSCYLYFDAKEYPQIENLAQHIINTDKDLYVSGLSEDGHRYVGEDPKNYICFGTDSKKSCLQNKDKYLYRVIGIFDGSVKLIKYSDTEKLSWASSSWETSNIYKSISKDSFYNDINAAWQEKIREWDYRNLKINSLDTTASAIYNQEISASVTKANVGLMYLSDYYLSTAATSTNCISDNETCAKSWLNNDKNEWTMAMFNDTQAVNLNESGTISSSELSASYVTRPVIYLKSDVEYIFGTGTINNPYRIDNYKMPKFSASYKDKVITLNIEPNDFDIAQYCYNESKTDVSNCNWIRDELKTRTLKVEQEGVYYIHLKDYNGRILTSNQVDAREIMPPVPLEYSKETQTIEIVKDGTYKIEAWGAQGAGPGGKGGYVSGTITLKTGDKLVINTGGLDGTNGGGSGTYNGGGSTTVKLNDEFVVIAAGGGGGATGTDGGNGTGAGGISVGSGAGGNGTNGSGGGSSSDYSGSYCSSSSPYSCNCRDVTNNNCTTKTESYDCNCTSSTEKYDCNCKNESYSCRCTTESYSCTKTESYSCQKAVKTTCARSVAYNCNCKKTCKGSRCTTTCSTCYKTITGSCTQYVNSTCTKSVKSTCSRKVCDTCSRHVCSTCSKKVTRCNKCSRSVQTCNPVTTTSCSTCYTCNSRSYYTTPGNPGQGGKNTYSSKVTIISNETGKQTGNGKALITQIK